MYSLCTPSVHRKGDGVAYWDNKRQVWRISARASRPGEGRRREVRDIREPHTAAGRRAAEVEEARLRVQMADDLETAWPGGTNAGSFAVAATAWLDRNRHHWSPKTVRECDYALRRYILPALGPTPLAKVSPSQVEGLYSTWDAQGYAPPTMRRWHGIVRAIFADAERLGQVSRNPMLRVRPAGGAAPERVRIPSPGEVLAAITHAASPAAAALFQLAAGTGARRGTLVALRWRDIDLGERQINFSFAVTLGPDNRQVLKGTKANRPYAVTIAGPAVEALHSHRARAAKTALEMGLGALSDLFVFSSDGGETPWAVHYVSHAWHTACIRAGISQPCRFHDVRHYAATRMLAASVPVRVVAERLGCTEANVIRTYSHRVPTNEDRRAAEVLAEALSGTAAS